MRSSLISCFTLAFLLFVATTTCLTFVEVSFAEELPRVDIEPAFGSSADRFTLRVTLTNIQASAVTRPRFDSTAEFQITPRGLFSREFENNGVSTYEIIFQYIVTPAMTLAPGKYQLPNGVMLIHGQKVLLQGPNLEITGTQNQQRAPQSEQLSGLDFTHIISSTKPYVGQQLLYRAEIVSERPLQFASLSPFEPNGYLRESLGEEARQERRVGTTTRLSMSEVLFPTKPGELEIPKRDLELHVEVPMTSGRRGMGAGVPFDPSLDTDDPEEIIRRYLQNRTSPFISRVAKVNLSAAAFPIQVRPLPPPSESGLQETPKGYIPVGEIEIFQQWSDVSIRYGESVTFSVALSGDANLRPYELPDFQFSQSSDFKVYKDKPELTTTPTRNGIQFKKAFNISLVPQKAGKLELPSIDLVWFDPTRERYQVYHIEKRELIVLPDPKIDLKKQLGKKDDRPSVQAPAEPLPKSQKSTSEIAPQKRVRRFLFGSSREQLWFFLTGLLIAPAFVVRQVAQSRRSARKDSLKGKLTAIQRELSSAQNASDAYQYFLKLIRTGLNREGQSLTGSEAQALLREKIPQKDLAEKCCTLLSELQTENYSGRSNQSPKLLEDTKALAKQIERFFLLLFLLPFLQVSTSSASDFRDSLDRADSVYENENWEEARRAYEQALRDSPNNAAVLYNLGNTQYHLGNYSEAVYSYFASLNDLPRDPQVKQNLKAAIRKLPDSVQLPLWKLAEAFEARFPFSISELLLLILAVWSVCWLILLKSGTADKRIRRVASILSLVLLMLLSDALFRALRFESSLPRIVMSENTKVYSTPGDYGQVIVLLQKGSLSRELGKKGEWSKVSVEGGRSGWIRESDLSPKLTTW